MTKIRKADTDRLASRFGRAPEAMRMAVGMEPREAASHLGLSEVEMERAVQENIESDGARRAPAAKTTAKKTAAKKTAAKKTTAKKTAKKTARKRAAKRNR